MLSLFNYFHLYFNKYTNIDESLKKHQTIKKKSYNNYKHKGSGILITLLLSTMILSLGISAIKMLMREIQMTSDLYFTERAYFAAESGVEIALLELKKNPVRHLLEANSDETYNNNIKFNNKDVGANFILNINNKILPDDLNSLPIEEQKEKAFIVTIYPLQSIKFLLGTQTTNIITYDPTKQIYSNDINHPALKINNEKITGNFDIKNIDNTPLTLDFRWKILCDKNIDGQNKTVSLQGDKSEFPDGGTFGDVTKISGKIKYSSISPTSMTSFLNPTPPETIENCYFSLENPSANSADILHVKFTGNTPMTRYIAKIKSFGYSGRREKQIVFDYKQKNLGALFDFVFFHTDSGL